MKGEGTTLNEIFEDNSFSGQISILKIALFLEGLHSLLAIWLIRKEWFSFKDSPRHDGFHKYFYNALWCQVLLKSMSSSQQLIFLTMKIRKKVWKNTQTNSVLPGTILFSKKVMQMKSLLCLPESAIFCSTLKTTLSSYMIKWILGNSSDYELFLLSQ